MKFFFIIFAVGIAALFTYLLYRAFRRNGAREYFNATTLGLPSSLRPFEIEPERSGEDARKELVLTDDPHRSYMAKKNDDDTHWVKIDSK